MTTKAIIFIIEVAIMLSLATTTIVSLVGYARQEKEGFWNLES